MKQHDITIRSRPRRSVVFLILMVIVAGCGSTPGASSSSAPSATTAPGSPSPVAPGRSAPSPSAPSSAPVSDVDIAKAVQFRDRFGLRADEPWARQVSGDPAHVLAYGV